MHTLVYSVDLVEMLHNEAFHQGLHCFQRQKWSSAEEMLKRFLQMPHLTGNHYEGKVM